MELGLVVVVLVAANVLNNRLATRAYIPTSIAAAVLLIVVARWDGRSWADLGLAREHLVPGLWWGLAALAVVAGGYLVVALIPASRPLLADRRVVGLSLPQVLWQAFVRVPLGTVLLEEVAFRGVLYAMLVARYGLWPGTLVSSVLFGLWHLLPARELPGINPFVRGSRVALLLGAVAITTVAGVIFGELRRRSGSLVAPAGAHLAFNSLGYLMAYVVTRRMPKSPG